MVPMDSGLSGVPTNPTRSLDYNAANREVMREIDAMKLLR